MDGYKFNLVMFSGQARTIPGVILITYSIYMTVGGNEDLTLFLVVTFATIT